ncbi:MAG: ATP-binding cassette domain-containing protein [Euryarchaeota archaeon]|nr:ATP-binding cassette domain-containing protein [Euryarchaeota archaeon]
MASESITPVASPASCPTPLGPPVAVRLEDAWVSYDGTPVVQGVSLRAPRGTSLVILGPSGAGKTTLLKTMNGILRPTRGRVEVLGVDLSSSRDLRGLRSRIGYIPQDLGLVDSLTSLENALMGHLPRMGVVPSLLRRFAPVEVAAAEDALHRVGLGERVHRRVHQLSGGERQRVAIARALVQRPELLLADEFVSDLDYVQAREVMDLVTRLRREMQMTLVTIQHEVDIARDYGDLVVVIKGGRKVAEVYPRDLDPGVVTRLFGNGNGR